MRGTEGEIRLNDLHLCLCQCACLSPSLSLCVSVCVRDHRRRRRRMCRHTLSSEECMLHCDALLYSIILRLASLSRVLGMWQ